MASGQGTATIDFGAMARTFTTQENPPDYTTILKLLAQRMEEDEEELFLLLIS